MQQSLKKDSDKNHWIGPQVLKLTIFARFDDPEAKESRCAKRCVMAHDDYCEYYLVHEGHCQLGYYRTNGDQGYGTFTDSMTYMRKIVASNDNTFCTVHYGAFVNLQIQPK